MSIGSRWAKWPHSLKAAIQDAGLEQKDITWVLPHQANLRIIDAAKKRLNIPAERYLHQH